jgi:iron complex transport system substrate-binding protein
MADLEELATAVLDVAFGIHRDVGPGLLESVYEKLMVNRLRQAGVEAQRQLPVGAQIEGLEFDEAFRLDILVENRLLVEVKAVDKLAPIHARQTLTYLRLMKLPLGLLINFDGITLKEGIKRVVNNYGPVKN